MEWGLALAAACVVVAVVFVARPFIREPAPPSDVPLYAWSDQFGLRLQHVQTGAPWQRVEIEHGADDFEARYLDREGRVVAGLTANRPRVAARLRRELAAMPVAA